MRDKRIGDLLRDARGKRPQEEVAKEAGLSPVTLRKYEDGEISKFDELTALCRVLHLPPPLDQWLHSLHRYLDAKEFHEYRLAGVADNGPDVARERQRVFNEDSQLLQAIMGATRDMEERNRILQAAQDELMKVRIERGDATIRQRRLEEAMQPPEKHPQK